MTQVWSVIAKQRQLKIEQQQNQIRQYFNKFNSPFYYISYADFCNNFQIHAGKNFKQQNLNIIDIHLKYRQWIFQQLAPYKWTPIIFMTAMRLIRLRRPGIIFPLVYVNLFDHYMLPFFIWLHKDDKIINMKYQFASKLSKVKNKQRRVKLFKNLQKSLKRQVQIEDNKKQNKQINIINIPDRYLKFGYPTQFVFHGMTNENQQMSTILQTKLFQTYMQFRYLSLQSFTDFFKHLTYLKNKFIDYKSDPQSGKYFLNLDQILKFKDIKQNQIYLLSTCIQKRIRRWIQIYMYQRKNKIFYSGFTLDKLIYLYQHKHMTEQLKYNVEQNMADLSIYYSVILLPSLLLKFFKR